MMLKHQSKQGLAFLGACAVAGSCWSVRAQQTKTGQTPVHSAGKDDARAKDLEAKNQAVLESDPRLKVKITIAKRSASLPEALRALADLTHVSFIADDNEARARRVSFSFENTPLKDVLDGVATLFHYELERRKSGVFVLRAKDGADSPGPVTQEQEAIAQAGTAFADGAGKLPASMQDALERGGEVSVKDLPDQMQGAAMGMLTARMTEFSKMPNGGPFTQLGQKLMDNFPNANVRFQRNGDNCTFGIGMPNVGSMMVSFKRQGR